MLVTLNIVNFKQENIWLHNSELWNWTIVESIIRKDKYK